jgi:hypothetical protein
MSFLLNCFIVGHFTDRKHFLHFLFGCELIQVIQQHQNRRMELVGVMGPEPCGYTVGVFPKSPDRVMAETVT